MLEISDEFKEAILDSGLHSLTQDWNIDLLDAVGNVLAVFPTKGMFHFEIHAHNNKMYIPRVLETVVLHSGVVDTFKLRNVSKPDIWVIGGCGTYENPDDMTWDVLEVVKGKKAWIDTFKIWI